MNRQNLAISLILLGLSWLLCACAPLSNNPGANGLTGFNNPVGAGYSTGGDPRAEQAIAEVLPKNPQQPAPEEQKRTYFSTIIDDAQLIRLDSQRQPQRLGTHSYQITLQIRNLGTVVFTGKMQRQGQQQWRIGPIYEKGLVLSGYLSDFESHVLGQFILTEMQNASKGSNAATHTPAQAVSVKLLYRAYKAKIKLVESNENAIDQLTQDSVKQITSATFAWISNWVVPLGRSFSDTQIVQVVREKQDLESILFSFRGETAETGSFDQSTKIQSGTIAPNKVDLVGANNGDRIYEVTLPSDNQFLITLDEDQPLIPSKSQSLPPAPPKPNNLKDGKQAGTAQPGPPQEPERSDVIAPAEYRGVSAKSYLPIPFGRKDLPRTQKMIADFERNWVIPEVQEALQSSSFRSVLRGFYQYAWPFRNLLSKTAEHFDVIPAVFYVAPFESPYFSKNYPAVPTGSLSTTAFGPFQLTNETAFDFLVRYDGSFKKGMRKVHAFDERNFLLPSACGAAMLFVERSDHYLNNNSNRSSDSTLGFLAFFLGTAGAENNVNYFAKRVQARIDKYSLDFVTIAKYKLASAKALNYVIQKLAAYFLSGDPESFGIQFNKAETLPPNTVPKFKMYNEECNQVAQTLPELKQIVDVWPEELPEFDSAKAK